MPIRVFRCSDCGHAMRFGAKYCGACHWVTPFYNRWLGVFLALVLATVGSFATASLI